MRTETDESQDPTAATLRRRVAATLDREFPDLSRGTRVVQRVNAETGLVTLSFDCGCSDGVSPDTERAIEATLVADLDAVTGITTDSGCGCGSTDTSTDDAGPTAPF
ncbi:hypothetical protein [Halobacterium sp. BOL4-2]|uniref:hypothetical protein n=1 Tax=Halobacterium sp. BOL4-2 TaxID=2810537 RepID=UPI001963709C|nr:hypothetical protein [Halobacterium sp. BOL4-2]QRY24787.1 hypothetical protein JRZ79_10355 [Halobacterium sp. BOL4-2]